MRIQSSVFCLYVQNQKTYQVKLIYPIIAFIKKTTCHTRTETFHSNDIYIALYPDDFTGKNLTIRKDAKPIRYSKQFWDYLIVSHPKLSMTIFCHHLYAEHYPIFNMGDSLYEYYLVGFRPTPLSKALTDIAGGIEKTDSVLTIWKDGIAYKPEAKQVDSNIAMELENFRKVLSDRNDNKQYILIYKRSFCDTLFATKNESTDFKTTDR